MCFKFLLKDFLGNSIPKATDVGNWKDALECQHRPDPKPNHFGSEEI